MNRPLWKLLRRYLVVIALMFWHGGFFFYASVVVPIGTDVFNKVEQGFVTQQVTQYLNLSGAICLVVLAWDLLVGSDCSRWRRGLCWMQWLAMSVTLAGLAWLHPKMDAMLDSEWRAVTDSRFYSLHRVYLYTQTVQWAAAMIYILLMLWAWRAEDLASRPSETSD